MRIGLAEQLALYDGFTVMQAERAMLGIDCAIRERVDLILANMDMPDLDGCKTCQHLRARGVMAPMIIFIGGDRDADRIASPDKDIAGMEYLATPFKFSALLTRVRALLHSFEYREDPGFKIGPYLFRPGLKLLLQDGQRKIRLTEKETNILNYLHQADGKSVAREELLSEVWGYRAAVTTHTLETHMYRLRQKIEPDPSNVRILLTEPGGYRLST